MIAKIPRAQYLQVIQIEFPLEFELPPFREKPCAQLILYYLENNYIYYVYSTVVSLLKRLAGDPQVAVYNTSQSGRQIFEKNISNRNNGHTRFDKIELSDTDNTTELMYGVRQSAGCTEASLPVMMLGCVSGGGRSRAFIGIMGLKNRMSSDIDIF